MSPRFSSQPSLRRCRRTPAAPIAKKVLDYYLGEILGMFTVPAPDEKLAEITALETEN
jgi:hypothetical protein